MVDERKNSDRREQTDRRRNDRRGNVNQRHPVLEICRSMLHLAVVTEQGGDKPPTVVTRSIRWRADATVLHSQLGMSELRNALRTLVTEEKLAGTIARIVLNGELCVTRVTTGTAEYVRRQLSEQTDRSQLYLMLGPGHKAQATCVRELDARHQHALLTVANQRTLDVLVQVAGEVGIQVGSIEPSLVALARAHGELRERSEDPCILIQVDERAAELGICHQGNLLLEYRPAGRTAAANLPAILHEHLSRLQRYIDRNHVGASAALKEVYLAGEPGPVELARRKFEELKDLSIHVLQPKHLRTNWQHSSEEPGTDMAAALGSALVISGDKTAARGPNLMEHVLAKARKPMRPVLLRSAIPLAAVLLLAIALGVLNIHQGRVQARIQSELDVLAPIQSRAALLRLQLGAADAKLSQLGKLEQKLLSPNLSVVIGRIGQSMPTELWLDRFDVADGRTGQLSGASYTDSGVFDFVNYLEQVPDVDRVALEGTGAGNSSAGPTTSFQVGFSLVGLEDRDRKVNRDD